MAVGSYHIVESDPSWPREFQAEKARIVAVLKIDAGRVEHVGSTAVPGLGAKPIIDLMVGVDHRPPTEATGPILDRLYAIGYVHDGIETVPGTLYCRKAVPLRFNLHLTEYGAEFWGRHLAFRDHLRVHPEVAKEYEALKRGLLAKMGQEPDQAAYTDGKTAFIVAITNRAMAQPGRNRMVIGFLASHRGSDMQAVIDACRAGRLHATPAVVISNNRDSEALGRAQREGIPHYHLSGTTHPDPEALDVAVLDALVGHGVDWVLLAGYMKKLGPRILRAFRGRVLNIHPALLPKYGGQGMYGDRVHEAVLAAGERETGVTIHLVDEEYDHGPIVAQCTVPVVAEDTVASLSKRVIDREHEFLVEALERLATGTLGSP